jgi:hypothetical protein
MHRVGDAAMSKLAKDPHQVVARAIAVLGSNDPFKKMFADVAANSKPDVIVVGMLKQGERFYTSGYVSEAIECVWLAGRIEAGGKAPQIVAANRVTPRTGNKTALREKWNLEFDTDPEFGMLTAAKQERRLVARHKEITDAVGVKNLSRYVRDLESKGRGTK